MKQELTLLSQKIRLETSKMLLHRGFGHLGGSFSIVEALAVLYGDIMTIDSTNPEWEGRDWFILSKGHAGPAYYAALAVMGYFDIDRLATLNDNGTTLPSHPDRNRTAGVDCTTGSLGQGVSLACGVAKAMKIKGKPNRVYCIIGDGECNEGQVWEAFQFMVHHQLDNLVILIDDNKKQLDGLTQDISFSFDFLKIMDSLGFDVHGVDGRSVTAIHDALRQAQKVRFKPSCLVMDTIKGQGSAYFESLKDNHHIRFDDEDKVQLTALIQQLERETSR